MYYAVQSICGKKSETLSPETWRVNYKNTISAKDCSHADRYHSVQGLFGRRDVLFGPIGACVDELGSMGLRLRRLSERLARAFARCGCVDSALGGFILSARLLDLWIRTTEANPCSGSRRSCLCAGPVVRRTPVPASTMASETRRNATPRGRESTEMRTVPIPVRDCETTDSAQPWLLPCQGGTSATARPTMTRRCVVEVVDVTEADKSSWISRVACLLVELPGLGELPLLVIDGSEVSKSVWISRVVCPLEELRWRCRSRSLWLRVPRHSFWAPGSLGKTPGPRTRAKICSSRREK